MNVNMQRLAAQLAHQANKAICEFQGDFSQVNWDQAEDHQTSSALAGVQAFLKNPDLTPEQTHQSWMDYKLKEGWTYGPVKDAQAKTHHCLVPYDQLPQEQRIKDHVFRAIMQTLLPHIQAEQDTEREINKFLAAPEHVILTPPDDAFLKAVLTSQDLGWNSQLEKPAAYAEDLKYVWLVPFEGKSYWVASNKHVMSIREAAEVEVPHPFAFHPEALEGLEEYVDEPSYVDLAGGYLTLHIAESSLRGSLMVYFHYETGDVVLVKVIDSVSHRWGKDRTEEMGFKGFDHQLMLQKVFSPGQASVPADAQMQPRILARIAEVLPHAATTMTCDATQTVVVFKTFTGEIAIMPIRVQRADTELPPLEQGEGESNPVPSQEAQSVASDGTH